MTVSNNYELESYTANGTITDFDFTFKILEKENIIVSVKDLLGNITTKALTTDYTISLNTDNTGTVIFNTAPLNNYLVYIERVVDIDQEVNLETSSGFQADVIENSLDKLTMITQQHQFDLDKCLKISQFENVVINNGEAPVDTKCLIWKKNLDGSFNIINSANNPDTVYNDIVNNANVIAVADNITSINTVADNITNVNTTATNIANINTNATNIASINTNATNITNINTNATNIANINTVANDIANVNTVANDIANVNTVADNIDDINALIRPLNNYGILKAPNDVMTYSGFALTVKSGLKILAPTGKKADGTNNNEEYTLSADLGLTVPSNSSLYVALVSDGNLIFGDSYIVSETPPSSSGSELFYYNPLTNIFYHRTAGSLIQKNACIIGKYTTNGGGIVSLENYQVLQNVNPDGSNAVFNSLPTTAKNNILAFTMALPVNTANTIGQIKLIQSANGGALSVPSGGTWAILSSFSILVSTAAVYDFGENTPTSLVVAGGTQIRSAKSGHIQAAYVIRIA